MVVVQSRHKVTGHFSDAELALKLFRNQNINTHDPMRREVERAMSLDHQYIIKTLGSVNMYHENVLAGSFLFDKIDFAMLMERADTDLERYVLPQSSADGKDLTDEWLREAKRYMWQMAQAVKYLHGKDMVHRDLKPANVLLKKEGEASEAYCVKLADFGFMKPVGEVEPGIMRCGTPDFAAPEALYIRDGSFVNWEQADMFSLGQTFRALLGRRYSIDKSADQSRDKSDSSKWQWKLDPHGNPKQWPKLDLVLRVLLNRNEPGKRKNATWLCEPTRPEKFDLWSEAPSMS